MCYFCSAVLLQSHETECKMMQSVFHSTFEGAVTVRFGESIFPFYYDLVFCIQFSIFKANYVEIYFSLCYLAMMNKDADPQATMPVLCKCFHST